WNDQVPRLDVRCTKVKHTRGVHAQQCEVRAGNSVENDLHPELAPCRIHGGHRAGRNCREEYPEEQAGTAGWNRMSKLRPGAAPSEWQHTRLLPLGVCKQAAVGRRESDRA